MREQRGGRGGGRGVRRLRRAKFLADQLIDKFRGIQPACRANEFHRVLQHLRRGFKGIFGTASALEFHSLRFGVKQHYSRCGREGNGKIRIAGRYTAVGVQEIAPETVVIVARRLAVAGKDFFTRPFGLGIDLPVGQQDGLGHIQLATHIVGIADPPAGQWQAGS